MEAFISIAVVLLLVAGFVFWQTRKYKDAFLDKLPLLPGEKILFEEKSKKLEASIGSRIPLRIFPNSMTRITNFRLIISQKVLGSERMALRYVFNFNENKEEIEPYLGYTSMKVKKSNISLVEENKETKIEIRPTVSAGTLVPYWVRITPENLLACRKALGL
ncbi:MAG: hypothetical protein Q7S24_02105 [bacterium]|nr:hypothetical protein [bacterium]